MRYLLLVVVVLMMFARCEQPSKKSLVWSDEFEYSGTPDSTKWTYDLGDGCPNVCGWGNNEAEYYTKDLKNVRVENGMLIIEAHKDSLGGKAIHVNSHGK
jgi:hypothetical protein